MLVFLYVFQNIYETFPPPPPKKKNIKNNNKESRLLV